MNGKSCVTLSPQKVRSRNGLLAIGIAAVVTVIILWTLDALPVQVFSDATLCRAFVPNGTARGVNISSPEPPPSKSVHWIRFPTQENATQTLTRRLAENGTLPCHNVTTSRIEILGMPIRDGNKPVVLRAGVIHSFVVVAYDRRGEPRCAGGDYYETDLSGPTWKSRPPVSDLGNGSYSLGLQVDPRLVGLYVLRIVLLFGNYNGLRQSPDRWARMEEMVNLKIEFVADDYGPRTTVVGAPLERCRAGYDYGVDAWSGRWTWGPRNESCQINSKGRFECLDPDTPCSEPWCEGPVGRLESNGWVYSAHCSFKIFRQEEAWDCLDKRWLFFWGDSNHVDTTRNLLNFVLGVWDVKSVPRRFDRTFDHPADESKHVRITSVFNGHVDESKNFQGLSSLTDPWFRMMLRSFFAGDSVPDTMIMNSGIHDGAHWKNVRFFTEGAELAAEFWESVVKSVERRRLKKPLFLYRTTVATAGDSRGSDSRSRESNPQKMEAFNVILLEKLREKNLASVVVDGFDLTFPWHYDHNCSDGPHYGRTPTPPRRNDKFGHQYFVDVMLAHILLNAICT